MKTIKWNDAASHEDASLFDIEQKPVKDFLVKRTSFGKILKQDKDGIIIATDIRDDGLADVLVIPRSWVIK